MLEHPLSEQLLRAEIRRSPLAGSIAARWRGRQAEVYPVIKEEAFRDLLKGIGEDPNRDGLRDTPGRVARALAEMTRKGRTNPGELIFTTFEAEYDAMVIIRDIPLVTLCEHHLMPITGAVHVGYLPNGRVVGISKIARAVNHYAGRLQIQERLTNQVAQLLWDKLNPNGVGVVVEAQHTCMNLRGAKAAGATTITSCMLGAFREDPMVRNEFLALIGRGVAQ